jgi:CheY-like chemotaxis protein
MSGTVLLVEDDADIRQDLAELLADEGWKVVTAADGAQALRLLRDGLRPALIILDLMMPVMNGWDFRAAQLADPHLAKIPVVIVSGAADLVDHAKALNASGFLTKPIALDRLFAAMKACC